MTDLRAAWLGHWRSPWPLDKGRRFGDMAWAFAAVSQAWILGGHEGRWPRATWSGRRPEGPRPGAVEGCSTTPDPAFIAFLRHGSPDAPAHLPARREDPLRTWTWGALLAGDAAPFFAAAPALLDLDTRLRWLPCLAAVEVDQLRVPPFLAPLLPASLAGPLPEGWTEALLSNLDSEGRLLPMGDPPFDLPWETLRPHLEPLLLTTLPEALRPFKGAPWLTELEGAWMLDPRLRAWGRGHGLSPAGLAPFRPHGLAFGDAPDPHLAELLALRRPSGVPQGWEASVDADLQETDRPTPPPASGEPTWDRLRMRWGGESADTAPGYPAFGVAAHPCADPFHWMAEGLRALSAQGMEASLRAFTLAHAHFARLGAKAWAQRSASNACFPALLWGDLPGLRKWMEARGPQPEPWDTQWKLMLLAAEGDLDRAARHARRLVESHPDFTPAWSLRADLGAALGHRAWVEEALPHIPLDARRTFFEAWLQPAMGLCPSDADPETAYLWALHRAARDEGEGEHKGEDHWTRFETLPNRLACLLGGLFLMEHRPEQRRPDRLLALQALADRAASEPLLERLRALWPSASAATPEPREALNAWLASLPGDAWLVWGKEGLLGIGKPPPSALLSAVRQGGAVPVVHQKGRAWWSQPIAWDGAPVGALLLAQDPASSFSAPPATALVGPWLARLQEAAPPAPEPSEWLLTDGSEPMASVMRELQRVAPSELSVLILGPTGSGKELAARELHRRSGRPGPLVAVNCAAFAESLLESELFGHTKGAFTGASNDRKGAIETAHRGTLFLDEVADLSPRLQSLLLRVLQEREVRRVGSERAITVDVRFLAATHRPLEDLAARGAFRRDLLFRLKGTVLSLPSLAERRHELDWLLPRLVSLAAADMKRTAPSLSPGLERPLARLPWPGNFRELRHAIERALLRCGDGPLSAAHFPELDQPAFESRAWEEATRAFQKQVLLDTLRRHRFHAADAAEALGLARPALYAAAKRLGLDFAAERVAWENAEGQA
ncbi:MAG: sigma-54-dependent Fis family transcriptional regulator [Acidobacteria bacterium]|nr:sigma-54-dependent Fis family transcriptional regulator [Acidobacteriota bacterium]